MYIQIVSVFLASKNYNDWKVKKKKIKLGCAVHMLVLHWLWARHCACVTWGIIHNSFLFRNNNFSTVLRLRQIHFLTLFHLPWRTLFSTSDVDGCGGGNDDEREDNNMLFFMTAVHSDVSCLTVGLKKVNTFEVKQCSQRHDTHFLKPVSQLLSYVIGYWDAHWSCSISDFFLHLMI